MDLPVMTLEKRLPTLQNERVNLSPELRIALNGARAFAACYVLIYHLANQRGWTQATGILFRFGQEAVIVFFLLSGVVIFSNEHYRASNYRDYLYRRFRRIYPPLLFAMVASTIVAIDNGDFISKFKVGEFIGTLFSLQDQSVLKPGVLVDPYLGNAPLWSLSYEVAFYIIFPIVLRGWLRSPAVGTHVIGGSCCVAYFTYTIFPNHGSLVASYFLVWWSGAMAADAYLRGSRTFLAMRSCFGWLIMLCAIAGIIVILEGFHGLGKYPFLQFRHFMAAAIMIFILYGPAGRFLLRITKHLAFLCNIIAGISYGIYVLHFPILIQSRRGDTPLGLAAMGLLLFALAYLADRYPAMRFKAAAAT